VEMPRACQSLHPSALNVVSESHLSKADLSPSMHPGRRYSVLDNVILMRCVGSSISRPHLHPCTPYSPVNRIGREVLERSLQRRMARRAGQQDRLAVWVCYAVYLKLSLAREGRRG
jgi:hypothetical protein